jgi:hypothetical protein
VDFPSFRDRWYWVSHHARLSDAGEAAALSVVTGLATMMLAPDDEVSRDALAATIAIGSGLAMLAVRLFGLWIRSSAEILLARVSTVESERNQYRALATLVANGQEKVYEVIGSFQQTAAELSVRCLPQIVNAQSGSVAPDEPAKRAWVDEVLAFRLKLNTDLKPLLMPHEWEELGGLSIIPPGPPIKHAVDVEHQEHLRVLERNVATLRVLRERYAIRP